jgi:hypothetical protein
MHPVSGVNYCEDLAHSHADGYCRDCRKPRLYAWKLEGHGRKLAWIEKRLAQEKLNIVVCRQRWTGPTTALDAWEPMLAHFARRALYYREGVAEHVKRLPNRRRYPTQDEETDIDSMAEALGWIE